MSKLSAYPLTILSGVTISTAFLLPGTVYSAILGWIAAGCLSYLLLISPRPYLHLYLVGLITNAIGFYWLTHTISFFGGFGPTPTAVVFLLFVTLSSVQHLIAVFFYRSLPVVLDQYAIRLALAWTVSEFISVRIFPWHYGHTQLAFTPLAQAADLAGAPLLTFLLFGTAEAAIRWLLLKQRLGTLKVTLAAFLSLLAYGGVRTAQYSSIDGPAQSIAVIQGNVSLEEKHDQRSVRANKQRYIELSEKHRADGRLIIWPETVITDWIDTKVPSVFRDPRLPKLGGDTPLLIGSLTSDFQGANYNSALAIMGDGTVSLPYHKQILMPFGEYVPFSQAFPWLKEVTGTLGDFTPGTENRVFEYQIEREAGREALLVSPLICYEDLVRNLARDAVLQGAELLVNISNDAWFGKSAAPYQHHLLASFRAIENKRYLIRATNTGYSAVVDPLGRTIADTPIFEEGVIVADVKPIKGFSIYTAYIGDKLLWLALVFCLGAAAYKRS